MRGFDKISWIASLVSAHLSVVILSGCGSGSSTNTPPAITVVLSTTSASVQTGTTKQFTASLQNDSQNSGVTWGVTGSGCSGAQCGTVSPASGPTTTYTAPPSVPNPATIILTATSVADNTKSASATIIVIPAPAGVSILPTTATVLSTATYPFTATVSPAAANPAVTWSLSGTGCTGAACGILSNSTDNPVTYTAPPTGPNSAAVTITATAVGDPTKQGSAVVSVPGIVVDARPRPISVPVNATQIFFAGVTNDPPDQGVTWTVTGTGCAGAACGTLSTTRTARVGDTFYTAPAVIPSPDTVTVTATSVTVPSSSGSSQVTITPANNRLLNGRYAFLFHGFDSDGQLAIAGGFNADGAGNITDGVEDINRTAFVSGISPLSFTGTYIIGPDNRGQMILTSSQGSSTFHFVINSAGSGAWFIEFDDTTGTGTRGSGSMQRQVASAFSLSQTTGNFVMGLLGDLPGTGRAAVTGRFHSSSTGSVSGAVLDFGTPSATSPNLGWSGSLAAPDATTGRGKMTFNATIPAPGPGAISLNLVYYILASNKLFVLSTDARSSTIPLLSGEVRGQNLPGGGFTNSSLSGSVIFSFEGVVQNTGSVAVGETTFDGSGNLTGILDQNDGGTMVLNTAFTGTYSVFSDGRATIPSPTSIQPQGLYLQDTNRGFIMEAAGREVTIGEIRPQAAGPFSAASLSGTLGDRTEPPLTSIYQDHTGLTVLDGVSNFTFTIDTSDTEQFLRTKIHSGTYSVESNGRATFLLADQVYVCWIDVPEDALCVLTVTQTPVLDTNPALSQLFKP